VDGRRRRGERGERVTLVIAFLGRDLPRLGVLGGLTLAGLVLPRVPGPGGRAESPSTRLAPGHGVARRLSGERLLVARGDGGSLPLEPPGLRACGFAIFGTEMLFVSVLGAQLLLQEQIQQPLHDLELAVAMMRLS
jgi:hypothetical protein